MQVAQGGHFGRCPHVVGLLEQGAKQPLPTSLLGQAFLFWESQINL